MPLPPPETATLPSLLADVSAALLLLAAATASLLVLRLGWRHRTVRINARRWSRLPWRGVDAGFVILTTALLLSGNLMSSCQGKMPTAPPPPTMGLLLLSMAVMPVVAILLCAFRGTAARRSAIDLLGLRPGTWRRDAARGILGGLALLLPALLLSQCSGELLRHWDFSPEPQDALRWLQSSDTPPFVRVGVALQAIVVAPILEEVIYRGVLLSVVLRTRRVVHAVLLVSVFFAALHLEAQVFLPLVFVGAGFAAGLLATGSLVTPIVMHMVFNVGNVLLVLAGT